jgi:hypothetical protein
MDDARRILDDVFTPGAVDEPPPSRRRRLRRPGAAPAPVAEVGWQPSHPDAAVIRVCKFGNVTQDDAYGLVTALRLVAPSWSTPVIRVADIHLGATEPYAVTARLTGDLDALASIFGHVLGVAEGQGFFLDRRSFRSEVQLGTLTVPPGAVVPESLPGAVIPVGGPPWTVTNLRLRRVARVGTDALADEVAAIPLGSFAAPDQLTA